jgi:hypothetical protein
MQVLKCSDAMGTVTYVWVQLVDDFICHHEVHTGLHICLGAKVLMIVTTEGSVNAVVVIQHGCDTVKPAKVTHNTM